MLKYIICLLLFSNISLASSSIDCNDPKNINECTKITFTKSEAIYRNFIQSVILKFNTKTTKKYKDNFLQIENKWRNLVKTQCEHLREFYQGGSIGSSSFISCYDVMYENRVGELQTIYDDIIGER